MIEKILQNQEEKDFFYGLWNRFKVDHYKRKGIKQIANTIYRELFLPVEENIEELLKQIKDEVKDTLKYFVEMVG